MKPTVSKLIPWLISAVLVLLFGCILLAFTAPMHDVSVDLSLQGKDNRGWTVYTQENDIVRVLQNNGRGQFPGIEPGQTLYMSRTMVTELESPALHITAAECNFIVWLDDEVIYSDFPELKPVPGQIRLPMSSGYRSEKITIILPANYRGQTLTIAQSTPDVSQTGIPLATPANVSLFCGFAYESGIVAEAYTLAMIAGGLFAVAVILMQAFLRQKDWSILCITVNVLLNMTNHIMSASFQGRYYGVTFDFHWLVQWFSSDFRWVVQLVSALILIVYLILKSGSKDRLLTGVFYATLLVTPFSLFTYLQFSGTAQYWPKFLYHVLPQSLFILSTGIALVFGLTRWRKENRFYRFFCPGALALLAADALLRSFLQDGWFSSLLHDLSQGSVSTLFELFWECVTITALIGALWDVIKTDLERRAERNLMEQNREMTMANYENMRRQHEEVMKLRHDMAEHLEVLHGMTQNSDVAAYIDNLIGQNARVRSVIHTGNQVMDVILGSKLAKAHEKGIRVEIDRCCAPEELPIPDAELSSIVINILTNAIKGAEHSGEERPVIKLDIHTKDEWLSFTCENSADIRYIEAPAKKETVPKHGLGLKIIQESIERNSGLFQAEYGSDYYKVRVILPLH